MAAWESCAELAAFDAIVRELQSLENDATLLIQSGKPVGGFRTMNMRSSCDCEFNLVGAGPTGNTFMSWNAKA